MKKLGAFQLKLILTLGISISLLVAAVVTFNYIRVDSSLQQEKEDMEKLVEDNILNVLEGSDVAYNIIETSLAEKMENYTNILMDVYKENPNIDSWDLDKYKQQIDGFDIFVLNSDLIITHSTRQEDLGLDFKEMGLQDLLGQRIDSGTFTTDRLEISTATKKTNKFSYMATPDKKYLIELGATADQFQGSLASMDITTVTEKLIKQHPYVKDIVVYSVQGNGQPENAMNKTDKKEMRLRLIRNLVKLGKRLYWKTNQRKLTVQKMKMGLKPN